MKKDNYIFPAIFNYADDGISIEFPDLPGCLSCADTDEEAYFMAKDVMRGFLLVMEELGEEIPNPTPLKEIRLKKDENTALIDVNLALYREPFKNRAVKKTLTIPMWLNEAAAKEGLNFSQILQDALKTKLCRL